ncbi:DUF4296 domain-containing protein [Flavobacterium sp.]|uniref:DUF4296 domain-containing protein n=1 Tax=Flavobacterium sp. TaxID=239 RepID=UPI001221F5B3|nr:DUF4296 domain-containing protein [Flavobacterium sp.]RZJ69144.1 MAG: DUF4296 domain-containing protein [Flavobacterium sp.]
MKKLFAIFGVCLLFACSQSSVEKPDKLIEEDKMVDIFYDLSLLEAIKAHNPGVIQNAVEPNKYIYKKYKIDSLQFAQSNRYYATDIKRYKRMYGRVNRRLERDKKTQDSLANKKLPTPSNIPVEGGMIK